MGVAQEIWQAFIAAHPEVTKGHLSLEKVNQKMAAFTQARNQRPQPDFEGLTPQGVLWLNGRIYTLRNEKCSYNSPYTVYQTVIKKGVENLSRKSAFLINQEG